MKNNFKSGKIRTSNDENIILQKIFLGKGYTFLNGRTEPHIRNNLDYFYFEDSGIISLGNRDDNYNNGNPFNFETWNGETNFKKKQLKEYSPSDFI